MTRFIIFLFSVSFLMACGQDDGKSGEAADQDYKQISVVDFISDASPFVDNAVQVKGTVVHVCRHGGQRLFIIGEDGEDRVRITTGDDIAEFDIDLEGETIEVTGIVRELIIDDTYLAEWEAEVATGSNHERGEGHEGGVGHGENHGESNAEHDEEAQMQKESQLARIQEVRDEIAQSGKDHLSDYWIETLEFKLIQN